MIAAPVTFQSYKIMTAPSKEELLLLLLESLFFSVAMSMPIRMLHTIPFFDNMPHRWK